MGEGARGFFVIGLTPSLQASLPQSLKIWEKKAGEVGPFTVDRFIPLSYNLLRIYEKRNLLEKEHILCPWLRFSGMGR
jgi:hypothetical protein